MEKMRNLFLRSQFFNKIFLSLQKDTIYMGIIYTSFLSRNLLCKYNYTKFTMFTQYLSLLYFVFSFLTYEFSYSKNINIFRKKCGIYFCDCLSNRILLNLFLIVLFANDDVLARADFLQQILFHS